jgi:hypothetical protein
MRPVFLLGSPRSGTTLLRLLLTAHPALVIAPESSFVTWFRDAYGDWVAADSQTDRRSAFVSDLMSARKFETWGLAAEDIDERIRRTSPNTYAELVTVPYEMYADSIGKPEAQWGDKNNVHMDFVPELAELFPTIRFLHIVRDVRDCFVSGADIRALDSTSPYKPNLSADPTEFARAWDDQNSRALAALTERDPDSWGSIRYEDLVVDPRSTLSPILEKWGIGWDDAMLSFHEENRKHQLEPSETSEWKTLVSEPLTASQVGRFRHSLSHEQIDELVAAGFDTLVRYGYVSEGNRS